MQMIDNVAIERFKVYLMEEEKAPDTVSKYLRDIKVFSDWCGQRTISKSIVLEYKTYLLERYATSSVNSVISSLNAFFLFMGWADLRVKTVKVQRQIFASSDKELSKAEYERLLNAARGENNERLILVMQTICSTGIRVSELKHITVESVSIDKVEISSKGKRRTVYFPGKLCKLLKAYINKYKIKSGPVFVTKNGKPLNRSNIWTSMKKLCNSAGVSASKVFPHNLRHLFARTYYSKQKDIVRLADILGHSSINTTRIYTQESGEIHRKQIQKLGLLGLEEVTT